MKRQLNPTIKAYLIRSALYVLLVLVVGVIPFALAQSHSRGTAKQSGAVERTWRLGPPASGSQHSNFVTARQAGMSGNHPILIQRPPLQPPPGTLWYNGDYQGDATGNGGANQFEGQFGAGEYAVCYDNFDGPASGQTWTVTGVFSNNGLAFPNTDVTTANWEIRTGVSSGNGGTVVASASAAPAMLTPTGRSQFGLPEYQVLVTGLNVTLDALPAGQFYFLAVIPVVPLGVIGQSFESTTTGTNCVGLPCGNDGNSWFNSNLFGLNFVPMTFIFGSGTWDMSMGVVGTSATPTPTPTPTPTATPRPQPTPRPRPTPPPRP